MSENFIETVKIELKRKSSEELLKTIIDLTNENLVLEHKIKELENHRDKAICYIDHEINSIFAIINSTNDITTRNVFIDRMQPYIDIKYLLLRGDSNE